MPEINPEALRAFRDLRLDQGLEGALIDDAEKTRPIDNGVSLIRFFDAAPLDGAALPALRAEPSPVVDPAPRSGLMTADEALRGDPEAFAARVAQVITANHEHLLPAAGSIPGIDTRYRHNAVVGQRIAALTGELTDAAVALFAEGEGRERALYAVHTAVFDLYSRELVFDEFEITGYGSFGHDSGFIHAWELRLAELAKVERALLSDDEAAAHAREQAQLQAELDAIFRDKYVYSNDRMFEVNAEVSIGLCLIDVASRQRVSEVAATRGSLVPAYELLSVTAGGVSRPVYFDVIEDKHYFDGSDEVVGADALASLVRAPLAADARLTFRRPASGEHLRKNFRFDWNGDGYVDKARIDWVSWAGHCNDKANLESHGVVIPEGDPGIEEYDSAAGSTAHYTRDLLNEILLSFSELDTRMIEPRSGRVTNLSKDEFAGARDDDRPDRIILGPQLTIPFRDRPNELEIQQIEARERTYDAGEIFRPKIVSEDQRSASDNPLYVGTEEGDRVTLDLSGAVVYLHLRLQVFDPSGYPTMMNRDVKLDFADPPAEPIFIDTVLKDAGAREIYEISLDLKGRRWIAQLVRMEPEGSSYRPVDVGAPIIRTFDPAGLRGQREVSLDDPAMYMPFVKEALQTGRNFTSETADGAGVWNGRTKRLTQRTLWRDDETRWAKVQVEVDARYGGNVGAFLVKQGADGRPDYYVPLALPFDFAWRTDVAFIPVLGDSVNAKARARGVISEVGGRTTAEALTSLCELLHAAFSGRRLLIHHQGRRYAFATRGAWEAARDHLEGLRRRALGEEVAPTEAAIVTLLEVAGQVDRKGFVAHEIVAEASGPVSVILESRSGDADLYVNVGGPATPEDGGHTLLSDNFGLRRELIDIPEVAAGTTIGAAVYGYKASEYTLTIRGPRPGVAPTPTPEPIVATLRGSVGKGEERHLDPITALVAGELDIQLSGSGDADVYVSFGRAPTPTSYAWRLYGPTSNERGRLRVRPGDVVHVMVHGYAPRSEFDLAVRSV